MNLVSEQQRRALLWFFCEPVRGESAALFRISFGLLAAWTGYFKFPNLHRYYSDDGMVPYRVVKNFPEQIYSVLSFAPLDDAYTHKLAVAFLVASLLVAVGLYTRLSLAIVFLIELAFQHRDPYMLNAGDRLFLISAGLGLLLPLSRKWSVDAIVREAVRKSAVFGRFFRKKQPAAPPFPLIFGQRVVGLHLCYIYLFAFGAKIGQPHWQDGSALRAVLASPRLAEWPVEIDFYPLIALLTWGTLVFELCFPLYIFRERARHLLLLVGVGFHVGIDVLLNIPMFTPIMLVNYAVLLKDDETRKLVQWVKSPWKALSSRGSLPQR